MLTTVLVASVLAVSAQTDYYTDMDQEEEGLGVGNNTALGTHLGALCTDSCNPDLINVVCKADSKRCDCKPGYPVRLDLYTGCAKPVKLGDQCLYLETCLFTDQNADCVQIRHNAICQCKSGFHTVTIPKPKRVFCSEDVVVIATDMSTLLGVATGLAVLTALICFVLKLFVGAKPRHYANSNLTPSIYFDQTGKDSSQD
ncbi:uncharacterized protein LOC112126114 [Cimex lectularius]|uniref:EB domain-containing protein n=1 Tax=Cimex lectularius TaxID=79782 RepID=A0A8I6TL90_CIMLE|nr:uncharacterized protein LOC112126114 [Cimex lectularius]